MAYIFCTPILYWSRFWWWSRLHPGIGSGSGSFGPILYLESIPVVEPQIRLFWSLESPWIRLQKIWNRYISSRRAIWTRAPSLIHHHHNSFGTKETIATHYSQWCSLNRLEFPAPSLSIFAPSIIFFNRESISAVRSVRIWLTRNHSDVTRMFAICRQMIIKHANWNAALGGYHFLLIMTHCCLGCLLFGHLAAWRGNKQELMLSQRRPSVC